VTHMPTGILSAIVAFQASPRAVLDVMVNAACRQIQGVAGLVLLTTRLGATMVIGAEMPDSPEG